MEIVPIRTWPGAYWLVDFDLVQAALELEQAEADELATADTQVVDRSERTTKVLGRVKS